MFKVLDIAREALGSVAKVAAKVPVIENKYHVKDRLRGPWPKGPFLWMHGASLGECKMLLNVAKFLKEDLPNCPRLLVTTQKVEVLSYIKDSGADVAACIAPADTPATMKSFVSVVRPLGLVLAENELWPGYLSSMLRISMRPSVAVISGRFHRAIPGMEMMIGGDWKLLPWVRSGEAVVAPENPTVDTSFISMHIQEWPSFSRMIVSSIKREESVVLVPRRLSEVDAFRKQLRELKIAVVDWPKVQVEAVSIVSQFGVTKDVFAISKSAVVGGSFARGFGVHDFWEPLQRGVATCVGPYAEGQKETVTTLVREGVMAQLQSVDDYSQRSRPDVRLVQTFLAHESAKISDSYQQLIEFLKNLLK